MAPLAARVALACALLLPATLARADEGSWADIRASLFGETRAIEDGAGVIALEAPYRALDAATVPIKIVPQIPQSANRYIKTLTLIIDENPSPVVGTFRFSPDNGIASLATRVRVNAYTNIRAIAETNDGALYMTTKYVKASGGCSAPAGKDHELALSRMGKMKLKQIGAWHAGQPAETQFMVSHPNYSGMQSDQVTQLWIPADYVRTIELTLGDKPVLSFEGDISMSENPSIRFFVKPEDSAVLHAKVTDSEDRVFEQSWPVHLEPAS
ncbi:quinoprotein dehydrogenase-associated SoxYZ-like carrier [Breoghania sp. L-A4]|nr:quinoprotein dehydrogenase-associated SoxYZ-like carrier [Breoghania sp. L-A4]